MAAPPHDEGAPSPLPVSIIHEFPIGYFVENIAVRPSGALLLTVHNRSELIHLDPSQSPPVPVVVHTFPLNVSGIVEVEPDTFYISAGTIGDKGSYAIWKVDMAPFVAGADETIQTPATISKHVDVPDALFLNGSALLSPTEGIFLAVDSIASRLFAINVKSCTATTWLQHGAFAKTTQNPVYPGANGAKRFGDAVYVSNTEAAQILRCVVGPGGEATGTLDVVAEHLNADDFTFDADGAAYLTTHIYQSVVKLAPDGTRSRIVGDVKDPLCAGSTAAAFGRRQADREVLYVTTTGGMSLPVNGEVVKAKVLRVEVGKAEAAGQHPE
ncbi:MAG: hypothetical protein M1824_003975 [Vezdaea acicularis]|nr:MAG: hypothetical protein M1824_003975 [Vezdaea acicularis]